MGLRLQPDADVLDGARDDAVGDAGEGAGGVVLGVGEGGAGGTAPEEGVLVLKVAAGGVEAAELDRDAGADAEERGERALVEGEGPLVAPDAGGGGEGRDAGRRGGLEADLDDVEGLA